jgi:class 3 adenylate cyclase/pimeloyl-ACP methyl ester carboxylesterase
MEREVRYCTTDDGVSIAYAVSGHGDRWLVHTPNAATASLALERMPERREWNDALGERFTLVQYDTRGTGFSQRQCDDLSYDAAALDLAAVVAATGAESVVLFGYLGGCYPAALYAIAEPNRVSHLVLWPPPFIDWQAQSRAPVGQLAVTDWETFTEVYAHTALGWAKGEQSHTFAKIMRDTITPETWFRFFASFLEHPTEHFFEPIRSVTVPTLVIQRRRYAEFARLGALLPGCRIEMVDGESNVPLVEHQQATPDAIFEFTGVATPAPEPAPQQEASAADTAVILYADVVDSTAITERIGDAAFRVRSVELERQLRAAITREGGRAVEGRTLGDGVLATFASAQKAIIAAVSCVDEGERCGLALHLGLHAGDLIHEADNVFGGAVNIASRISGLSAPGEILASQTVRDLARTSAPGVTFEDGGEHFVKGVADPIRIFAVRSGS